MYLGDMSLQRALFSKPLFTVIVSCASKSLLLFMSLFVFPQALRSRKRFFATIIPATYMVPYTTVCNCNVSREMIVPGKCLVTAFFGANKWSVSSMASFVLG